MVAISEPMGEALEALRRFNYERIYLRRASRRPVGGGRRLVARPRRSLRQPPDGASRAEPSSVPDDPDTVRAAVGYVSGMTDRFACTKAEELFGDRVGLSAPGEAESP